MRAPIQARKIATASIRMHSTKARTNRVKRIYLAAAELPTNGSWLNNLAPKKMLTPRTITNPTNGNRTDGLN